jgi:glucose-6-phosphate 1-dehydrogenase
MTISSPAESTRNVSQLHNLWCVERVPDPCGLVIFGASGDLTERKLVPALCSLFRQHLITPSFFVVGFGRTKMTDEEFRNRLKAALKDSDSSFDGEFLQRFYYAAGDYNDPASYQRLAGALEKLNHQYGTQDNRLFYLSTPPTLYAGILARLGVLEQTLETERRGHIPAHGWSRIVIEKPFGQDLASARLLSGELSRRFTERQVYRMDHYLGKETVQNILAFRFANTIFEPVWNRAYIDHVQITAAEEIGVGHRAGYYDEAGCLRDMVQNHVLQLLCLTAMEAPVSFDADRVRDEKTKVLHGLRRPGPDEVDDGFVRGQYAGYLEEPGVKPDSATETFVAAKVFIDNWRWEGVPFYLRAGKRMTRRVTDIAVQFRRVPHLLFSSMSPGEICPNTLLMRIQPDEGIMLSFEAKSPGPSLRLATVPMNFSYSESFRARPPEAYERLFLDSMLGDQTLFAREDWLELSWSFIDVVTRHWAKSSLKPRAYSPGSWGPPEARQLIESDGRSWYEG